MKVAVIGGTGKMGGAIARKLSEKNEVIIGSRDPERAKLAAGGIPGARGADYAAAAGDCDVAVFALPYSAIGAAEGLGGALSGKLVLSMVVPLRREGGMLRYALERGSAAEELARLLPGSRVATAFNNVPVAMLLEEEVAAIDILVATDTREAYEEAAAVVRTIPNLRPLYAGPLSEAGAVERMTPLLLNLAKLNETKSLSTRFVSEEG
jgi:8-hydroxy-5-deazaflavin:NADPH oxidoreductase